MNIQLPKVRILATGGTIAGQGNSPLQTMGYKAGQLSIAELLSTIPSIENIATISGEQFANLPSSDLTPTHWLKLAKRINTMFTEENDLDGLVITHGTDTLEESAYFLNLVVKTEKPVVLVGAMRPATALSSDGPMNLVNAIRVAASKHAVGLGVLVVMNDEIYASRDVTKTNANRLDTFGALDFGTVGTIDNGNPEIYYRPTRRHTVHTAFDITLLQELPRVDIVLGYVGADEVLVTALLGAGAKGIILAGTGAGHISPPAERVLREASQKGPVIVRGSRTGTGRILPQLPHDFIAADNLSPQKARVLLMLALTLTQDPAKIQEMFFTY